MRRPLTVPLVPPPGIVGDDTAFATGGGWVDGNNVRFVGGRPESLGGYSGSAVTNDSLVAIYRLPGDGHVYYAAPQRLFRDVTNVSPAVLPSAVNSWSLQAWGSTILLANPTGGKLYKQTGTSAATVVTQGPSQITVMIVTQQRQVLALGCNEEISGAFNGLCIRGSDLEDYTNWTTSSTNNAFEHILGANAPIKAAATTGAYIAVWTSTELFIGQFIGDPGQAYRFDKVADVPGPVNPAAVATFEGVTYWIDTFCQLWAWSPGSLPAIIPCPILKDFRDNLKSGADAQLKVGAHLRFGEVWILYADQRDVEGPSRYLVYSIPESQAAQRPVWFRGQLARSALYTDPANNNFYLGGVDGTIYIHDTDGSPYLNCFITFGDLYLNNGKQRAMITRFTPDFKIQTGDVALTLYMRDRPASSATAKGPYMIATTDTKKDFRASGMIAAGMFSAFAGRFRLGKPLFDTVPLGER
jgi:hypothetical protein